MRLAGNALLLGAAEPSFKVVPDDPKRDYPSSVNIALPAQSDGSIRLLSSEERAKVAQIEQRKRELPQRARLLVAFVALIIGGLTIWYTQVGFDSAAQNHVLPAR